MGVMGVTYLKKTGIARPHGGNRVKPLVAVAPQSLSWIAAGFSIGSTPAGSQPSSPRTNAVQLKDSDTRSCGVHTPTGVECLGQPGRCTLDSVRAPPDHPLWTLRVPSSRRDAEATGLERRADMAVGCLPYHP